MDEEFQRESRELVAGIPGVSVRAAPPKGFQRMRGKLDDDHRDVEGAKSAANIDLSRNGITAQTPEGLARAYSSVTSRFGALRCKNNYRAEFDALHESFGYRAILANMMYVPKDEHQTWSQLLQLPQTQQRLDALRADIESELGEGSWQGWFEPVLQRLLDCADFADRPVRFVVESQFILSPYMEMRKESHLWYKIVRTGGCHNLMFDFRKYSIYREI